MVLAQNAEKWELANYFSALLDLPAGVQDEARRFAPEFTFRLIQLAELPFERIVGTPAGVLILRTLKAEQTEELLGDAVWDEALIARAPREIFAMVLRYILAAGEIDTAAFEHRVEQLRHAETRKDAMTLAQQYHQQGLEKGRKEGLTLAQQFRQEGEIETRQRAVIEALEARFEHVPVGLREKVEQITDASRLQSLHCEAIRCAGMESFSAAL